MDCLIKYRLSKLVEIEVVLSPLLAWTRQFKG
jgi:hypothetical protein